MPTMLFVNLPVADVEASKAYYKAQGFDHNPQFSDDTTACIVLSDTIFVMVMTPAKFASFSSKPIPDSKSQTGALYALSRDSREAVDAIAEAGLKAGGTETRAVMDYGFMYSRAVADPDGHTWEYVWMDMDQMPPA